MSKKKYNNKINLAILFSLIFLSLSGNLFACTGSVRVCTYKVNGDLNSENSCQGGNVDNLQEGTRSYFTQNPNTSWDNINLNWYVPKNDTCPAVHPLNAATVELNVNFQDGIFICEIGFDADKSRLYGRETKRDYISVTDTDGNKTIITAENNNPFIIPTAEHAEKLNTANIYLNSIQYGSSYYVKYCYEYSNQLETAVNTDIPTTVDFYGDVKLTIANSNGYYEHAGVEGKITASCDIDDIEFLYEDDLDFGDNSIFATSFYTQFIFDLSENFQNMCVFKISFDEERKSHIRKLKDGEVNYSANVNTEINYYSDFSY